MQRMRKMTAEGNNIENDEEVEGTRGKKGKMEK